MEDTQVRNQKFEDRKLVCIDCGQEFEFPIGEQRFFASKNLSTPRRCPSCRKRRRDTLVPDTTVHKHPSMSFQADNLTSEGNRLQKAGNHAGS
ncbi:MAG: zinc-ribbon domain-containing protein [Nitrososphaerota archaeon]|nr:zinc-ribbon domain-containing protein [Nitrososphaerota archaeon]